MAELTDEELQRVYCWVDSIQLSRPKRNISRDFADGVLAAEVVHSYLPGIVELHNYSAANSITQKEYNWVTLNDKVFRKFGYRLSKDDIGQIVRARPGVIERVLLGLEAKLEAAKRNGTGNRSRGSSDMGQRKKQPSAGRSRGKPNVQGRQQPAASKFHEPRGGATRVMRGQPVQDHRLQQESQWDTNEGSQQAQMYPASMQREVDQEILFEKEQEVQELRETIDILELKVKKLEQLVRLKDSKIQALTGKLNGM